MMSELRPCRSIVLDIRTEAYISKVHDISELKHTCTDIKFMRYQKYKQTACRFKDHDIRVVAFRSKVHEFSEIKAVSYRNQFSMDFLINLILTFWSCVREFLVHSIMFNFMVFRYLYFIIYTCTY